MNKQIEDMAIEILEEYTNCFSEADEKCLARMLKGLASDVAREIFTEIEKLVYSKCFSVRVDRDVTGLIIDGELLAELKKKYGVKEDESES